jgi:hypothetical protein
MNRTLLLAGITVLCIGSLRAEVQTSKIKQEITLRLPSGREVGSIEVAKRTEETQSIPERKNCYKLSLPAKETVSLRIGIR